MCTGIRFTDAAGNMFFGRNLDWTMDYGELVVVTPPKAVIPPAFARPNDPRVGRAVIGVGIVVGGVPLYFDCANDAGLAVAGLNFPQSAHYATAPVSGAENVAAYEFPYWIARNFSSLTEVRDALKTVNASTTASRSVRPTSTPSPTNPTLVGSVRTCATTCRFRRTNRSPSRGARQRSLPLARAPACRASPATTAVPRAL